MVFETLKVRQEGGVLFADIRNDSFGYIDYTWPKLFRVLSLRV